MWSDGNDLTTHFQKWVDTLDGKNFEYKHVGRGKAFIAPQTILEINEIRINSVDHVYFPDDLDYNFIEDEEKEVKQIYNLFANYMSRRKLKLMIELLQQELLSWENSIKEKL